MRAPLVALVLLLPAALAGCLGGSDEPPAEAENATGADNTTQPEVLPDGREFAAVEETNKTEEGAGGMLHLHDYWAGAETVTIYDADVAPELTPLFERDDNTKVWIAFVNLEKLPGTEGDDAPDALVFEGTGLVTFTITSAPAWASSYQLSFRTAGKDWSDYAPISPGEAFEYAPEKTETDMPHSFRSLWNWKLQAVDPAPLAGDPFGITTEAGASEPLHVQIVVTKSRSVDDWPGHPAFYEGVDERIVMDDATGRTNVQHAADVLVYGVEPDQLVPDKLVSMGTHTLDIYVNITTLTLPPGVENDGFFLFWRHASTRPDDLGEGLMNNETDGSTWAYFHVQLDPETMLDSPYQPESRFSFKLLAAPANSDAIICYRCMPYELEYVMTVVARPMPVEAPAAGAK